MRKFGGESGSRTKVYLSTVAMVALATILGLTCATQTRSQSQAQDKSTSAPVLEYDVAKIKPVDPRTDAATFVGLRIEDEPDGFVSNNLPVKVLIQRAYGVEAFQVSGAADWVSSQLYEIEAKMDPSVIDELQKLNQDDRKLARQNMLQKLLSNYFKLVIRRQSKDLQVYTLTVGKSGPKLQEAKPTGNASTDSGSGTMSLGGLGGPLTAKGAPIANLARMLSGLLRYPVLDRTGLTGKYDFTLQWAPDETQGRSATASQDPSTGSPTNPATIVAADPSGRPSLFTAIQEQLGLRLESQKGPVEIIVIDHIEKPSGN